MNCKPGDIAKYVGRLPEWSGQLFEVLHVAPAMTFILPSGRKNVGCPPGYWVVKVLGVPRLCEMEGGGRVPVLYGSAPDAVLRPIRDGDLSEDTEAANEKPAPVYHSEPATN